MKNSNYPAAFWPLTIVSIILCVLAALRQFWSWNLEDAYIIYRIVRNILGGEGWAFNAGEIHNASTSVLNTVLISIFAWPSGNIAATAHLLAGVWTMVSATLVASIFFRRFQSGLAALVAIGAVYLLVNNAAWGLEVHLLVMLLLIFAELERLRLSSSAVLGLIVLARPDGMLLAAVKYLKDLLSERRLPLRGAGQFILVLLPWVIFSLFTFGQIFPDTLSNKIWQGRSGFWGNGWIYYQALRERIFTHGPLIMWSYLLAVPGIICLFASRSTLAYLAAFVIMQQAAYVLLNVPGYHWYFAGSEFVLYLSAAWFVCWALEHIRNWCAWMFPPSAILSLILSWLLPIAALGLSINWYYVSASTPISDSGNRHYELAAADINAQTIPEGALASVEVGTLGYLIDRPIVDLVGLTSSSPEMVSGKNTDLFFDILPRIVLVHWPVWNFELAIYNDPRFKYWYDEVHDLSSLPIPLRYFVRSAEKRPLATAELDSFIRQHYPAPEAMVAASPVPAGGACALDSVNGRPAAGRSKFKLKPQVFSMQGWVLNLDWQQTSPGVSAILRHENGQLYRLIGQRSSRVDVAKHFKRPELEMSGFIFEVAAFDLPDGTYSAEVLQDKEGQSLSCKLPGSFIVGQRKGKK